MRICMVASSYPRYQGDIAGTFVAALAEALTGIGHHVSVVAPADPLATAARPGMVPVTRFGYSPWPQLQPMGYGKALYNDQRLRLSSYAFALPYLLSGVLHLARALKQWQCDLIHVHWMLPNGPVGVLAAVITGKPMVITLHGSDAFVAKKSQLLGWFASRSLAKAKLVAACSPDLLADAAILGAPTDKLRLIPWGADPVVFGHGDGQVWRERLGLQPEQPVVLAVGRMVDKKGFGFLLEAFNQVRACLPSAVLVLGGEGPLRKDLQDRGGVLGLEQSLRFCGHVPWQEMPDLLATATIVVVPSIRDQRGNVDGLPTVALEAMAAGKPVVASNLAGLPLAVQHGVTGLLVPPGDPDAIAGVLLSLLRNPGYARWLGYEGRARVERELNWQAIARRYVSVYQEALDY